MGVNHKTFLNLFCSVISFSSVLTCMIAAFSASQFFYHISTCVRGQIYLFHILVKEKNRATQNTKPTCPMAVWCLMTMNADMCRQVEFPLTIAAPCRWSNDTGFPFIGWEESREGASVCLVPLRDERTAVVRGYGGLSFV